MIFFLRELGIGIVAYSPLGRGFFSAGTKLLENLTQDDYRKVCGKHTFTQIHVNYLFILLINLPSSIASEPWINLISVTLMMIISIFFKLCMLIFYSDIHYTIIVFTD